MISASWIGCCLLFAADASSAELRVLETGPGLVEVVAEPGAELLSRWKVGPLSAEQGEAWLRFSLLDAEGQASLPMLGRYERTKNALVFRPQFRLLPDRTYRAEFGADAQTSVKADHRTARRAETAKAVVEQVFPSGDVLPANTLKFYVHFSKPMRETSGVFDQIAVLDDQGQPRPDPWRRLEIWTPDAMRLTLYVHPGRIKQGVNLREEEGTVFEPNRKYTLVVDGLIDADGQTMAEPFRKTFTAADEDRSRPLPKNWKLDGAVVGRKTPLTVRFGESIDRHQLDRLLKVYDPDSRLLAGEIQVGEDQSTWTFTPNAPWSEGRHMLSVDEDLEDLAGNTPRRLFDTDLTQPRPTPPVLAAPFEPAKAEASGE